MPEELTEPFGLPPGEARRLQCAAARSRAELGETGAFGPVSPRSIERNAKGRMHLHTVPVFIAIIGGLFVFGASGVVLGLLLLAVTDRPMRIWQRHLHRGPLPRPSLDHP